MIRDYEGDGSGCDEAVIRAMDDCRQEGILADFLREHGTEAVNMLFTEFNMEDALDVRYEEGQKDGMEKGLQTVNAMLADGRADELLRLESDPAFLKEMMVHYHIGEDIKGLN